MVIEKRNHVASRFNKIIKITNIKTDVITEYHLIRSLKLKHWPIVPIRIRIIK